MRRRTYSKTIANASHERNTTGSARVLASALNCFFLMLAAMSFSSGAAGEALGADPPNRVALAADGKSLVPIVVGQAASERTRQAATTLARYLGQITGPSSR